MSDVPKIVLASSSPARKKLLASMNIEFNTFSPDIDETPLLQETLETTVARLAKEKTLCCQNQFKGALIIGCDQLLAVNNHTLGKPHTHAMAVWQLQQCSGNILTSYTAISLRNTDTQQLQQQIVQYQIKFKQLDDELIEAYLLADKPYQCAGGIKAESLGPCLFEWQRGDDPSALIGLPLIALNHMLHNEQYHVLKQQMKPI
jgi:septum formation protein